MKLNVKTNTPAPKTHEGAAAAWINAEQQLRRSVMSCLLWESEYYEDGESISKRITDLAMAVKPETLAALAIEARTTGNLRHVPLLLTSILCKTGAGISLVSETVRDVIQRADELSELLAVYAHVNGVTPDKLKLSAQLKKGLAMAFDKFDEYSLAKYNRDGAIKLRDVLFLCHAKGATPEREALYKRLVDGELKTPDTWEVALSSGADKKTAWETLLREGNLGYLALLRNLRNMGEVSVDRNLIKAAIKARAKGADRVLPFRFIAAARHAPAFETELDQSMQASIAALPKLKGTTVVLVDVSGSMDSKLSGKSDLTRIDAAAGLASIVQSDDLRVFSFSHNVVEVPARRGLSGVDAVINSQQHGGTELIGAVQWINTKVPYDRLIVITDEQASDDYGRCVPMVGKKGYMINVASAKNGIGYGQWTHIDGFSENVLKFIYETENQ